MTKEELMHMARDVGALADNDNDFVHEAMVFSKSALQDLANAILERAAAECDELPKWMQQDDHMQGCVDSAYQVRALKIKEGE